MRTALATIALAWILAFVASSQNVGGAGGAFDCGSDCTAFQDLVNTTIFVAPVIFVVLLVMAAITRGRST
jgi:hypothetical protein